MTDLSKLPSVTRRRFLLALGAAGASAAAGSLLWSPAKAPLPAPEGLLSVSQKGWALGAQQSITVLHENRTVAERALKAAFAELETVESVLSLYRGESQLCRLNREGVLVNPHPYLRHVLQEAQNMSAASEGDFDITVQPLWKLYAEATINGLLPNAADIARVRQQVDWRKVMLKPDRIQLKDSDTAITLNGIAQGFAADCVLQALKAHGVKHALVDTGEIGGMGNRTDGELWSVGIQHPRHKNVYISKTNLDGRCIATSGDYATTFSPDRAHHHIFNPHTGRSPNVFQSVTVIAKNALMADALSTTIFVAGAERGMRLIESTPGVDGLFVLQNGNIQATDFFKKG